MQLKQEILRVWTQEITEEMCRNLVHSMPDRIQAVLKAKGKYTKNIYTIKVLNIQYMYLSEMRMKKQFCNVLFPFKVNKHY